MQIRRILIALSRRAHAPNLMFNKLLCALISHLRSHLHTHLRLSPFAYIRFPHTFTLRIHSLSASIPLKSSDCRKDRWQRPYPTPPSPCRLCATHCLPLHCAPPHLDIVSKMLLSRHCSQAAAVLPRRAVPRIQANMVVIFPRRDKQRLRAVTRHNFKPEPFRIKTLGFRQLGNMKMNMPHHRLRRQSVP